MVSVAQVIRPLTSETELRGAWPLVSQLRPDLDEDRFVAQMRRQTADGCRATVLDDGDGAPRGFACWRVLEMLAVGRHVHVDDLVIDATTRSHG